MSRRWFHSHLNGMETQRILLDEGVEGSFLVRKSYSRKGQFVLSVRHGNKVNHIKIHNDGELFDLNGGEKFNTLTNLVEHYMTHPRVLKEQGGIPLPLLIPIGSPEPTNERWFHGQMSRKEAEYLILEKGRPGSYLVRESQSDPGNYVLTVNIDDKVAEIKIRFNGEKYDIGGGEEFLSLNDLMKYYSFNPMVDHNGSVMHLMNPVNVTRISIAGIVDRVFKLEHQKYQHYAFGGFWEEFDVLQQWETKRESTKDVGFLIENKSKNRYRNILPYDHSRIILKCCDKSLPGADYINANMIKLEPFILAEKYETRNYIVTQGCLRNTVDDFWKMIWQEDSRIIVMITKLFEKSKEKCMKYWPDLGQSCEYSKITVENLGEYAHQQDMVVRMFNISLSNYRHRRVLQYHYTGWPDHGVPSDAGSLLDLQFVVNARQFEIEAHSDVTHPLTVHCSAGIGRTGTFVVLDILIGLINRKGLDCELDIQRTTHLVRSFRPGLVQSEAQYQFIYTAINHYVQSVCSRISAEKKIEMFGREYLNIKYTDELATVVGEENVPTLNPCTAQRVLKNAISCNTYPTTDSPLVSPTLDKSNVVELLGYDPGKPNDPSQAIVTNADSCPNSPTSNVFELHSYENITSPLPSSECDIGPPPMEAPPPPPESLFYDINEII
ncbi:tyrosine-protein phosphatase non-receptor type 11-like isoform X1 [Metopolophium dirhodum]|uniref:tyrosine-protein phosphatase non-receptor type 11-like isoform X1 n=2 Tax=Metopolophium dirhodum TaxID=44670 RepID=UPI00298FF2E5|nr:tyrosine-protein phosphatase non-receptor type 11-like isoform X1 [Metopolophium dirhodum]